MAADLDDLNFIDEWNMQGVARWNTSLATALSEPVSLSANLTVSYGTTANKANQELFEGFTLGAGATSNTHDLRATGVTSSARNLAVKFATIKRLMIVNTGSYAITVGNATLPVPLGFGAGTSTWTIPAGAKFDVSSWATGWTVGSGATDQLKVANDGSHATSYTILILGDAA